MNARKILCTAFFILAHAAHGDTAGDLASQWQRAEDETHWQPATLVVTGLEGDIQAFVTTDRQVKLDNIGDSLRAQTVIESSDFSRYRDQNQMLRFCASLVNSFPGYRSLKTPYLLRMKIFPGGRSAFTAHLASGDITTTQLGTTFAPLDYFKVLVVPTSDAMIARTGLEIDKLQSDIVDQLMAQKTTALSQGEVSLDLTGLNDLVCDLVAGHVKLQIQIPLHFTAAKLEHETRLQAEDAQKIYADLSTQFKAQASSQNNLILGSILLGVAVQRETNLKPELRDDELVRLQSLFFAPGTFTLRGLDAQALQATAQLMDRLSDSYASSMPVYETKVLSPFGGQP